MRKVLYILGQLTDQDADWLSRTGRRLRIGADEVLIHAGIRMDQLFIVLDGELQVRSRNGKDIARVGVGDILGEMSFVDDSPTSASVAAITNVQVLAIDRGAIKERLERDTAFAARFYKAIAIFLADRMRNTLAHFGYGDAVEDAGAFQPDELDGNVLDNLHLAGASFERMLRKLIG